MVDWSCGLPRDVLASILQRLSFEDCIRSGAVCADWRSLVAERGYPPSKHPWLLLPRTHTDEISGTCNFYSLSDRKEYKIHLPGVPWIRCLGASDGWLVIYDERFEMSLLNPLTRSQIGLPSLAPTWPWGMEHLVQYDAAVAVSWSSPSSYNVVLVIAGSPEVAFVRVGDEAWTVLREEDKGFYHVVHHKGIFYIQDHTEWVSALDLMSPSPKLIPVRADLGDRVFAEFQLVQSSGDLFQLFIKLSLKPPNALYRIGFEVFKLDPSGFNWIKVNTLGNQAIFLGHELAMSLSAHDFPGLEGSCIYFVDAEGIQVFNFEDGSINAYSPHDSHLTCPIPIWFVPNMS